ncbi:MAG TPA: hybrid sensor histidine kinase/response regulator, partial [Bacteroidetes bacterium]|nr:hybrid sensor histidine kinase/response regulator [Bacteroidota bacterium]
KEKINSTSIFLDNLLNWATSQFNSEKSNFTEFNLYESVNRVVTNWGYMFKNKNNDVENLLDKNTKVFFDNNLIKFVVRNILLNANKFTDNGNIKIIYNPVSNQLKIIDNGCGMKEETRKNLFNWEARVSTPGTQGESGSGLGLKVCYDMLKQNNADLTVESKVGEGSEFTIHLPSKK